VTPWLLLERGMEIKLEDIRCFTIGLTIYLGSNAVCVCVCVFVCAPACSHARHVPPLGFLHIAFIWHVRRCVRCAQPCSWNDILGK